ncbi:hypothetical protein SAY86_011021 [Trapa natans]|uniref:Uncharacterized protein n=1 Tax=Trapa natans TaxID=22666 RepID=A0AAN7R633_TRANT|nr:hypothetical protein SAY86_011021 [Trapa natans]
MSLVDYASSSDEEKEEEKEEKTEIAEVPKQEPAPAPSATVIQQTGPAATSSDKQQDNAAYNKTIEKLPDVSLLLNTPLTSTILSSGDHASRVAAAIAESSSRKRNSNVLSSSAPAEKLHRGTLARVKNVPETGGGLLVPPQLSGRSNVATEDLSKLFVRRHRDASSQ